MFTPQTYETYSLPRPFLSYSNLKESGSDDKRLLSLSWHRKKKTEKICTASLVIIKISVRIVSLTKRKNIKRIKNRVKQ